MITPEDLKMYPFNLLVDAYQVNETQILTFCKSVIDDPESIINKVIKALIDSYTEYYKQSCRNTINAILDHYKYSESAKKSCKENHVAYRTYSHVQSQLFTILNRPNIRQHIMKGEST